MATSVAADPQMALAVAPRSSSSHLNKPARQFVPAFLQKLYEMVNDPTDHDLIRWSDAGDSFFVLDQERFASEVLGRWFKHKNFSSFVRQLNMYGFHKIPHLQQGVLRAENETEFWNFEHPHFIRGQPDMLCLIQRKKQGQGGAVNPGHDDGTGGPGGVGGLGGVGAGAGGGAGGGGGTVGLSQNQLLDINSIVNGIQAIKRHQAAISADLNELKMSNQHLWQEAMFSRERHRKHQDTINRIVKFLAGVFGHAEQMHKNDNGHTGGHAVVQRKPQRLMIVDGKNRKRGVEISDVTEDEGRSIPSPESLSLFGSVDTPTSAPSEPFASPRFASLEPSVNDAPTPTDTRPQSRPQQVQTHDSHQLHSDASSTSTSLTTTMQQPPQNPNDAVVQAALTQVLSSPSQMQKLLQALQNQSISSDMFAHHANQNQQQLIGPYDASHLNTNNANTGLDIQPVDHHRLLQSSPSYDPPPSTTSAANAPSPFTLSLLGGGPDADQLIPFEKHDERLQKTYHTAAEISHDVDELQSNINSFLQTLGIDLSSLEVTNQPHSNGAGGASPAGAALEGSNPGSNGVGGTGNNSGDDMGIFTNVSGSEFDFDSFLLDMPRATGEGEDIDRLAEHLDPSAVVGTHNPRSKLAGASTDQLHAFLDEVASQDGSDIGIPAPPPPRTITVPGSSQHTLSHTIPPPLTQLHNHNSSTPSFGAVPIPASVPAPSTATPGAGPVVGRGKKRKSEVGDGDDATPQPSTLGTPPSTTTNKTKRKR